MSRRQSTPRSTAILANVSVIVLVAFVSMVVCGPARAQEVIALWPDGPPTDNQLVGPETGEGCVGNISEATLSVFHPEPSASNGAAILVIPGGGYAVVCMDHEGAAIARWLNARGFTAGVLKYRLPNRHYEVPIQDAQQALRLMRRSAAAWDVSADKIGVMGFSAGGHLASTVGTHFDTDYSAGKGDNLEVSRRPDFMMLVYPVVSMMDEITHKGSVRGLIGERPDVRQRERFSNSLNVTDRTPPTFVIHSADDKVVPVQNSTMFFEALISSGVPAELHVFEQGGHGYAASEQSPAFGWVSLAEGWLGRTLQLSR